MILGREFCFTLLSINLSNTRSTEYSFEILLVFRLWGCRFFTISFSVKYVKDIKKLLHSHLELKEEFRSKLERYSPLVLLKI
ncbi:hypothetical protein COL47_22330 [Bacillus toyonensis]|nr:hypothetical protein BK702_06265 [Bacillus thuringiensis serovar cameroun]PFY14554.1 hypothetical protein COL47_22330 [Bacillus toyonensis]